MTSTTSLADAVGAAGWGSLLPAHRSQGGDLPVGDARLLDVLPLGTRVDLAVVSDARDAVHPVPLVRRPDGSVRRARPGEGAAAGLVALLRDGSREVGRFAVTAFTSLPPDLSGEERSFGVDQTNESVVAGESAVVKWAVPSLPGRHPAPVLLRELVAGEFLGMPSPWGLLEWQGPQGPPRLLAGIDSLLPGAVDGWTWAVEEIGAAVREGDLAGVAAAGEALGTLLGEFHGALAGTSVPAGGADAAAWRTAGRVALTEALSATTGEVHENLRSHLAEIREIFARGELRPGDPLMLVHGDLHVGQILRAPAIGGGWRYAVTDFDGNPVVEPEGRGRPEPSAVDLAGLLQSVVHAGIVLRKHHPDLDAGAVRRATAVFTGALHSAYRTWPGPDGHQEQLIAGLRLRQVLREFAYAAAHLPRWSYVPEAALPALLSHLQENS